MWSSNSNSNDKNSHDPEVGNSSLNDPEARNPNSKDPMVVIEATETSGLISVDTNQNHEDPETTQNQEGLYVIEILGGDAIIEIHLDVQVAPTECRSMKIMFESKMTGGTPEVRSDKNSTLLIFDI